MTKQGSCGSTSLPPHDIIKMEFDLNAVDFHVSINTGDEVELEDVQE